MLITTSENIPGKNIVSTIGYVKGSSARARHAVADVFASLKYRLALPSIRALINSNFKKDEMNDSERTIVETKKICDYVGCNLNIIYIPNSIFWKPDAFSEKYRKRLLKFSMKLNIQFVDTTNILNRN